MSEETTSPQAELPVPETPAPEVPVVKRKRIVKAQAEEVQHEVIIKEDGEVPKSNLVEIEVDPASIAPKVDIAGCYGDSEEEDLGIISSYLNVITNSINENQQLICGFQHYSFYDRCAVS